MDRNRIRRLTFTAACIALGVLFPMIFHGIPRSGMIFLPMHLPVLLCGLLAGPGWGLACGLITPMLSSILTSMPPAGPILISMIFELAVYGLIAGIVFRFVRTKWLVLDVYAALVTAMLCGRIVNGVFQAFIFSAGKYHFAAWIAASFTTCWPGIVMQLVLIPFLYLVLDKANLLPEPRHQLRK